jgi:hypothetical protein
MGLLIETDGVWTGQYIRNLPMDNFYWLGSQLKLPVDDFESHFLMFLWVGAKKAKEIDVEVVVHQNIMIKVLTEDLNGKIHEAAKTLVHAIKDAICANLDLSKQDFQFNPEKMEMIIHRKVSTPL